VGRLSNEMAVPSSGLEAPCVDAVGLCVVGDKEPAAGTASSGGVRGEFDATPGFDSWAVTGGFTAVLMVMVGLSQHKVSKGGLGMR
jgi:hypothetical protein